MAVNRINEFMEACKGCKSDNDFKTLATTELEYLDNHLVLSSKKRALTDYRNALKLDYPKNHCVFNFLNLTGEESTAFKHAGLLQLKGDHTNLKPITPIDFVETGTSLICTRKSYSAVAVGLCLLTGRREAEILKTGSFQVVDDSTVLFTGQIKKKEGDSKPFIIPVLADSQEIVNALTFVRSRLDATNLDMKQLHSRCNKTDNEQVKRHYWKHCKDISVHSLRAIYAEICTHWFKPEYESKANYIASILGHSELDLSTAQRYEDFYIPKNTI